MRSNDSYLRDLCMVAALLLAAWFFFPVVRPNLGVLAEQALDPEFRPPVQLLAPPVNEQVGEPIPNWMMADPRKVRNPADLGPTDLRVWPRNTDHAYSRFGRTLEQEVTDLNRTFRNHQE